MSDSVYKVVELVGTSEKSWEDAAKNAVETAASGTARPVGDNGRSIRDHALPDSYLKDRFTLAR